MNLKGKGTTITVKTLNGKIMENSKVIEGFEASNSSDFARNCEMAKASKVLH